MKAGHGEAAALCMSAVSVSPCLSVSASAFHPSSFLLHPSYFAGRRHYAGGSNLYRRWFFAGLPRASEAFARFDDVPANHHRVILVHNVMTVHDVLAQKVFPTHEDFHLVAWQNRRHVASRPAHENL